VESTLPQLAAWESFYVIVGSSGAALTGLQFVVIVLGAEVNALVGQTTRAFGTPTVVHFCSVLLVSAILSAPWTSLGSAAIAVAGCGAAGVVYIFIVIRDARRQTHYVPVLEDWLFHGVFPLIAYASLLIAAVSLPRYAATSLFVIGGAAVLLLFVGIHNALDSVTYIAMRGRRDSEERRDSH